MSWYLIFHISFQVFGRTYPPRKAHYSGKSEADPDFLPLWEAPLKASKIQPQFWFLKRLQIYVQMTKSLNFSLEAFPENLETGVIVLYFAVLFNPPAQVAKVSHVCPPVPHMR